MPDPHPSDLTLGDRLSHLTYAQACALLAPRGKALLFEGGAFEIDPEQQVRVEGDRFRLELADATVTICLADDTRLRLDVRCDTCTCVCVHRGAALSLILEEKTTLGLAAPPPERTPVESLGEEELVARALEERRARAKSERMTVRSADPKRPWTDYRVTSVGSGRSYRVALRGGERGESHCSCPDFRKNTLGTCKHVLHVLGKAKRRFTRAQIARPYRRRTPSLHLRYGREAELRLALPAKLDAGAARILGPLRDVAITDLPDLLRRLRRLDRLGQEVAIYPDADEFVQSALLRERLGQETEKIRSDPARHPLRRTLLDAELLPYQLDGIAFAVGAGRAVLADDMGLGKTIQAIGTAELLRRLAGIERVLVVCPATLKAQWRSEIERFTAHGCQLVLGSAAERPVQYASRHFFTLCNYEQVLRDVRLIEAQRFDLIVLDEAQRIKNWDTQTSRVIKALRSRFALALTGTPIENRLDDLFSIVEFIDERRLGPAFRFFNRYRTANERGKTLGYENLGELRETLEPVLLRRTRASVNEDLPPRTTEVIRVTPTQEQAEIHATHMRVAARIARKRFISEMDLLRLQKALLLCRMAADSTALVDKEEPGHSSKLEALRELLDGLAREEGRKIVLFSEWTSMLDRIEKHLRRLRLGWVRLDGKVPQAKRRALVERFGSDPTCRLFLTTNAGATGLNLQAADTVINVDLPWNPALLEQRIARAHRMGQQRPVQVFILVTEETIEENLLATLSSKQELFEAVLDPDSEAEAVDVLGNLEELRSRLEILLGTKPAAPVSEVEKRARDLEGAGAARRERVSEACGALVSAAFTLLGEVLPEREPTPAAARLAERFREQLAEGLEEDGDGGPTLRLKLPDRSALDALASTLGRLLADDGPPQPARPAPAPRKA